jgi:CheY-like chemotaxis protein
MNATALRVLIVDDDADSARMLKVLLKKEGYVASIASDGPAAVAAAKLQIPDVVLLDLSLPGLSGIEVAEELRRAPERAGCVFVAVTGHGKDSMPSPSPFDRYFVKPLDVAALLAYLAEIQGRPETSSWAPAVA